MLHPSPHPQDRFIMFRDMHLTRNKQLGRLHERLSRELNRQRMDDNDRRLEALKANDFEAYKELLKQTYGPLSDDDRFAGALAAGWGDATGRRCARVAGVFLGGGMT
jgi:hypothetical protein